MQSDNLRYFYIILRRLWIVILAAAIAGGAAYVFRSRQPAFYTSEVRLFVGNALNTLNPDASQIETGQALARTYAQLVKFSTILNPVIEELELDATLEDLQGKVSTGVVPDTPILSITVTDTDAQLAADIANEIGNSLILNSPADLTDSQLQQMQIQADQIDALNAQVTNAREDLIDIVERRNNATDPDVLAELDEQYSTIIDQINTATANIAQLQASFLPLIDRSNKLQIAEPARPSLRPTGISVVVVAVAGTIVGALLSTGVILFFAYIDNKFRRESDVRNALNLQVLGMVNRRRGLKMDYSQGVPEKQAQLLEDFRTIQANLFFSPANRERGKVFIVASAKRREGTTFTAVNLAVSAAKTGLKVLVIDADLRAPTLHDVFHLDNSTGLSTLLSLVIAKPESLTKENSDFKKVINNHLQETPIENLYVMTSGVAKIPLTTQVLGFDHLGRLINKIQELHNFDLVVLDSPPVLTVADSYVAAGETHANIVLVVEAGRTSIPQATKTRDQFLNVGSHISGVVLNKA